VPPNFISPPGGRSPARQNAARAPRWRSFGPKTLLGVFSFAVLPLGVYVAPSQGVWDSTLNYVHSAMGYPSMKCLDHLDRACADPQFLSDLATHSQEILFSIQSQIVDLNIDAPALAAALSNAPVAIQNVLATVNVRVDESMKHFNQMQKESLGVVNTAFRHLGRKNTNYEEIVCDTLRKVDLIASAYESKQGFVLPLLSGDLGDWETLSQELLKTANHGAWYLHLLQWQIKEAIKKVFHGGSLSERQAVLNMLKFSKEQSYIASQLPKVCSEYSDGIKIGRQALIENANEVCSGRKQFESPEGAIEYIEEAVRLVRKSHVFITLSTEKEAEHSSMPAFIDLVASLFAK